ncbi:MAG: Hsp20/alpha crystallin family protein [Actinomycetota bacterium]|nr:Hsp20/alpha crystallin family protein [Actinomycetota bacterium]
MISAELAGVPPRDIDISVSEGVLTISGERQGYPDDADDATYVRERYYGTFRRSKGLIDL